MRMKRLQVSDIYALLDRIAQAPTVDAVWDHAVGYFRTVGFARANYGYTRYRRDHSIGDPDDALFLSSHPPDYARLYFREGFYARTPMYRWVTRNTGVTTWRWVEEAYLAGTLPRDEAEAVRINRTMGVIAGISISFAEALPRSKGALGLTADAGLGHDDVDRIWAVEGQKIETLANMMHLKIIQLPLVTRRRPLTDRQREVLEWVADGKSAQDIAQILDVSLGMVEKHLRLARAALDVDTTAQAVAKGTLLNGIFLRPTAGAPPTG
jgi:DNA-binding CsgD family transcriptional regulator